MLARVKAAEQQWIGRLGPVLGAMAEARLRPRDRRPARREHAQRRIPREGAEAQHEPHVFEQIELAHGERQAGVALLRGRLVRRRRAAHGGRDPGVAQREAVAGVQRRRLVGEAGTVQRGEEEVARAVAGEDPAGAVRAVGGRREAEDHHGRARIAEAGDRSAPVLLVAERGALLARDELAPRDEPRAAPAGDDLALERG
jgi:hypothetical protein